MEFLVIPTKVGIQRNPNTLDPRLHGDDEDSILRQKAKNVYAPQDLSQQEEDLGPQIQEQVEEDSAPALTE